MSKKIEIIIRTTDEHEELSDQKIFSQDIIPAIEIEDLGIQHSEQLEIIKKIQSIYIGDQVNSHMPYANTKTCPKCGSPLSKNGIEKSDFHDALIDVKIGLQKFKCSNECCPWNYNPTIYKIFGTQISPELKKLQATLGSQISYRKAKDTLNRISSVKRAINNHVRIAKNTYQVGQDIMAYNAQYNTSNIDGQAYENRRENYKGNAYTYNNEMILVVDGGYVHDATNIGHNFEIMVSKIYRPENIAKVSKDRYQITKMNCSGSAKKDSQKEMISRTQEAAKAEGMNQRTKVTVLADGAKNCWNIANELFEMCAFMVMILDWFHIAKYFQNILNIANSAEQKILDEAKAYIWNGDYENGMRILNLLHDSVCKANIKKKILTLITYLGNNKDYLTNYAERHEKGLPYSSSVAESTVEQVINSRFKKKSKARWNRINSDMLLQVRLSLINCTFDDYWDKRYSAYIPAA